MKIKGLILCLLVAGCDNYPRDPEGTSDRIADSRQIRVGIAHLHDARDRAGARRILEHMSHESGARLAIRADAAERLLYDLEEGRLDLVIAPFHARTPWAAMVALSPPIVIHGRTNKGTQLRAAMRSGENRWIMRVEKAARAVAEPGAAS